MEMIMDSLIKIAALLLLIVGSYLGTRLDAYLREKGKAKEAAALDKLISELVAAAEQMYKKNDEDGSARLNYVQGMLLAEGYILSETVRAQIESHVFKINQIAGDAQ